MFSKGMLLTSIEMLLIIRKIALFSSLMLAVFVCGCLNTSHYGIYGSKLDNTTWIPVYVLGQEATELPDTSPDNREAYIQFVHRGYGRFIITGRGGVNSFTGSMEVLQDGTVLFEPIASTLKIGKNHGYEACFVQAFREADILDIESNNIITLSSTDSGSKVMLAKFQKVER